MPGISKPGARTWGSTRARSSFGAGGRATSACGLRYSELPHYWAYGYESPLLGLGTENVVVPPGWVGGATTAAMAAQINANMRPFKVKTDRETLGVGANKFINDRWEVVASFRRDEKEGDKLIGAVIGTTGGNPRAAILPEPVDWTTDQVEIFARYSYEKLQFQVGYYGSFFRNDHDALRWQNPYSGVAGWAPAAGFGTAVPGAVPFGQLALPPDNQFHQLNASAGYSLDATTRLSGNFSIGRGTQDEDFLPYSINPALVTAALPRSSLDGEIITTSAPVDFTTRLRPKLGLVARYRYSDRDNQSPRAAYNYVGGDSMVQLAPPAALATSRVRINLPVDSTDHQAKAELDYQLAPETRLSAGYEFHYAEKSYEAIDWEYENTLEAGARHRFSDIVLGGLSYAYSDRETSDYDATEPFRDSHSTVFAAAQGAFAWDNVPSQKRFFLAPRTRNKLRAFLNVMPNEQLDVAFSADYKDDQYSSSELGLREATGWTWNVDATWLVSDTLTGNAFLSMDHYESSQRSVQIGGVQANFTDPARYWSADIEDDTITWGLGVRAQPMENLELGVNFIQAHSEGEIDVSTGPLVTPAAAPLPEIRSRLDRFELFGDYRVRRDLKVRLEFIHERYRSRDWAVDAVEPAVGAMPAFVIATSQESPDYSVNVIGISAVYQFQ